MTVTTVKFSQLRLSPLNVRKVEPKGIEQMATSILAHGIAQSLAVYEEGGKLVYLGGNGLDCEVEFLDEHRIVYHNTRWSHSEDNFSADGEPHESRMHRGYESQAQLLGQVFTWPGAMTGAPY